jgi:hypothetical protein
VTDDAKFSREKMKSNENLRDTHTSIDTTKQALNGLAASYTKRLHDNKVFMSKTLLWNRPRRRYERIMWGLSVQSTTLRRKFTNWRRRFKIRD